MLDVMLDIWICEPIAEGSLSLLKWTIENGKTSDTILFFSGFLKENRPVDPWITQV